MKKLDGATDTDKSGGVMEESEGSLAGEREMEKEWESARGNKRRKRKKINSYTKLCFCCATHTGEF